MEYVELSLAGPVLFKPTRHVDSRGYFSETFRCSVFQKIIGANITFIQDNQSFSKDKGTLRGLHYQSPPSEQGKLVKCPRGAILDVAVDARKGSPSFGRHVSVELTADNGHQLWVPEGFLHGFVTREANTIVQYKCTSYYEAPREGTVLWNDSDLAIDWGLEERAPILSKKDEEGETFAAFESPFIYKVMS